MLNKDFIEKMTFLIKKLNIQLKTILLYFCIISSANSLENKIIYKINDEIITSFDLKKELRYLSLINTEILNLEKNDIFKISKK